jgi:hypothetical protein
VAAGVTWARRHYAISPQVGTAAVGCAVLPDVLQGVPILLWIVASGADPALIADFAVAGPGTRIALPAMVDAWSHHLHCILHSAPIALVVSLAISLLRPALWPLLAAWWSHIVIDVLTHSNAFYPVPVLYPFTMAGFDGIPWNTPWFVILNYTALAIAWLALGLSRPR